MILMVPVLGCAYPAPCSSASCGPIIVNVGSQGPASGAAGAAAGAGGYAGETAASGSAGTGAVAGTGGAASCVGPCQALDAKQRGEKLDGEICAYDPHHDQAAFEACRDAIVQLESIRPWLELGIVSGGATLLVLLWAHFVSRNQVRTESTGSLPVTAPWISVERREVTHAIPELSYRQWLPFAGVGMIVLAATALALWRSAH